MGKFNDLDKKKWKEYEDIITDSLWIIKGRDKTGVHSRDYHGNFVPQIPNQLLKRFTKKGDWVLDPFCGGGTTLIEAQRLDRNAIGIELSPEVAENSQNLINQEANDNVTSKIIVGNSKNIDYDKILKDNDIDKFQFSILHPPYWDIIKFSENPEDLSNEKDLDSFLSEFDKVIENMQNALEKDRHCALVIGDKYSKGEWIPLNAYCMKLFMDRGFILKSIIVKNIGETKGKSNQHALWRYRALASDYYLFTHEYIMIFKNTKKKR